MQQKKILYLCLLMIFSLGTSSTFAFSNIQKQQTGFHAQVSSLSSKTRINPKVLSLALRAHAKARNNIKNKNILTVIDYSLPSSQKRMWVIDLQKSKVIYHTLVAHGRNSGEKYANRFSNKSGSRTSSLGVFVTKNSYYGSNGYSLRLDGLDYGFNDKAYRRAIVMHGAPYVSESIARTHGRIGRSWACPSVPTHLAKPVINTIKGGSLIFAYANDRAWLQNSRYLKA